MDPERAGSIAATGFLAIGTKILAEKDPVKKRADIVDEQIDTMGRVFLALSLGCARCHDHKFDPVSERDYYALAGIFHSTKIEDRELHTPDSAAARKARHERTEDLKKEIELQEQVLETLRNQKGAIEWEAEDHARGNVIVDRDNYVDIKLNVYHELDDHIYDNIDIHVQHVLNINININIKCDFEL